MFQCFYDHINDRFLIAPLRCASSHTASVADTLNFTSASELVRKYRQEGMNIPGNQNNDLDAVINLISAVPGFKDTRIVTVVRDPYARYLSAMAMIFNVKFSAPAFIDQIEVNNITENMDPADRYVKALQSPYNYVDRALEKFQEEQWCFDFSWGDGHMVPVVALQLMLYCAFSDRTDIVLLNDYDDWLNQNYPAGTAGMSEDFYHRTGKGYSQRKGNVDMPLRRNQLMFDRFLKPLAWYNQEKINRLCIVENFYKFLWFDRQSYELISNNCEHNAACNIIDEFLNDPYFLVRNKNLYGTTIKLAAHLPSQLQIKIFKNMANVQQYAINMTWLNTDKNI